MQTPKTQHTKPEISNTSWGYRLGLVLFFGAFPIFFATPFVIPMLGLSAGESATLIGGILLTVEVLWFASIPLLGKEGFETVKKRAFGWLKLSSDPISQSRHRFGVALLFGSILIDVLFNLAIIAVDLFVEGASEPAAVFLGMTSSQQMTVYIGTQILTTVGIIVALFILGSDFWGRLKNAFHWQGQH